MRAHASLRGRSLVVLLGCLLCVPGAPLPAQDGSAPERFIEGLRRLDQDISAIAQDTRGWMRGRLESAVRDRLPSFFGESAEQAVKAGGHTRELHDGGMRVVRGAFECMRVDASARSCERAQAAEAAFSESLLRDRLPSMLADAKVPFVSGAIERGQRALESWGWIEERASQVGAAADAAGDRWEAYFAENPHQAVPSAAPEPPSAVRRSWSCTAPGEPGRCGGGQTTLASLIESEFRRGAAGTSAGSFADEVAFLERRLPGASGTQAGSLPSSSGQSFAEELAMLRGQTGAVRSAAREEDWRSLAQYADTASRRWQAEEERRARDEAARRAAEERRLADARRQQAEAMERQLEAERLAALIVDEEASSGRNRSLCDNAAVGLAAALLSGRTGGNLCETLRSSDLASTSSDVSTAADDPDGCARAARRAEAIVERANIDQQVLSARNAGICDLYRHQLGVYRQLVTIGTAERCASGVVAARDVIRQIEANMRNVC